MFDAHTFRDAEVQRYLASGDPDHGFAGWPGDTFIDSARRGGAALREALIAQVHARTVSRAGSPDSGSRDIVGLTRDKVGAMVTGLFATAEQPAVLRMLERSVVFLTRGNLVEVLRCTRWLRTAWSLANLYLASVGAQRLCEAAPEIVGLSHGTTCCVSPAHFHEQDPFADFVVLEAAHVFHNCKRAAVGLPRTGRREWLLDIDFGHRETFAYACEAYSRIVVLAAATAARRMTLTRHAEGALPCGPAVDLDEYLDILDEAVQTRNGWKRILQRCAPRRSANTAAQTWRRPPATAL